MDGFLYHGERTVRKNGRVKIDNLWYENQELTRFVGEIVFVYNDGSYWKTEYIVYPNWAKFDNSRIICTLTELKENGLNKLTG